MATPRRSPPTRARREEQARILTAALDAVRRAARPALAIFDLDSTLLDNRPRQARILREFGGAISNPALIGCRAEHVDGWDLKVAMRNAGLSAAEAERLYGAAKNYWRERFFTSEYCVDDDPIDGAADFLSRTLAAGGKVVYVTGRQEEMRAGSVESFKRHGYPIPDGARVDFLLKPYLEMSDDLWKETAHKKLREMGQVAAAFDNEPAHINAYVGSFPECYAVHLDTDNSGRPIRVLDAIPSVADFVIE
jgi:hypothetical protein